MITLIHPSRGRPNKAFSNYHNWISKSSGDIEHILSLDKSDPQLPRYKKLFKNYIVNDNTCVVEATNHAAKLANGDILIYLSDDFDCPKDWDKKIIDRVKSINTPWLLKVDDCLQKFFVPVLTIPIMSRSLYEKLGYFWYPEYKSMFVDEDLFWTCKSYIIEAPSLKFPHLHPANGKAINDETYKRSAANWDQGKELFKRRREKMFK